MPPTSLDCLRDKEIHDALRILLSLHHYREGDLPIATALFLSEVEEDRPYYRWHISRDMLFVGATRGAPLQIVI